MSARMSDDLYTHPVQGVAESVRGATGTAAELPPFGEARRAAADENGNPRADAHPRIRLARKQAPYRCVYN